MKRIALHGVPRSGTSWLGAIFDSSPNVLYRHQPLFSYAFKSYLNEKSSLYEIKEFYSKLSRSNDDFLLQKEGKEKGHIPTFSKEEVTHIAYKEARYHNIIENLLNKDNQISVIGIVRNPKSVLASWINAPLEFDKINWLLSEEWQNAPSKNLGRKEEFYGYYKWKEVAAMFLNFERKFPLNFYLLKYHDLLMETEKTVESLFDFCELEFTLQTRKFINSSLDKDFSHESYSVFRKHQSDFKWESQLDSSIINCVDNDLKGTKLSIFNE